MSRVKPYRVFISILLGAPASLNAGTCALCREALRSGGSARLLEGYYWSIILIVAIPLIIMGVALAYAWKRWKAI